MYSWKKSIKWYKSDIHLLPSTLVMYCISILGEDISLSTQILFPPSLPLLTQLEVTEPLKLFIHILFSTRIVSYWRRGILLLVFHLSLCNHHLRKVFIFVLFKYNECVLILSLFVHILFQQVETQTDIISKASAIWNTIEMSWWMRIKVPVDLCIIIRNSTYPHLLHWAWGNPASFLNMKLKQTFSKEDTQFTLVLS